MSEKKFNQICRGFCVNPGIISGYILNNCGVSFMQLSEDEIVNYIMEYLDDNN